MFYELLHLSSADYFKKIYCKNFSFPPHIHNCFELVACLSGETMVTVDDELYTIKAGEALLVFPHQLHSFQASESENMICIFSPKIVSAYYNSHAASKPVSNKFILDDYFISSLDSLEGSAKPIFIKGLLYLICDTFDSTATYTENANKGLLERLFIYINENFTGSCDLKTLAANMGYNPSYLSRYFKGCVGINLCEYINMVRLGHVCYLYENFEGTLLSFALDSGFDSLRTFNRNFKKFYGVPPKEFFKTKNN